MYRAYAHDTRDAHQPRHPPAARAARRQRPPQDGAPERAPLLDARHARPLLRRRDRDGRQRLPRRSQRRAHADAVERRSQRRLLAREPAAADPADHHRPRVPLRGDQRRGAAVRTRTRCSGGRSGSSRCASASSAFGRGTVEFLAPVEPARARVRARSYEDETILVVANLSRYVQFVELDLVEDEGHASRSSCSGAREFPPIGELPYLLTLGGHDFYWFSLEPPPSGEAKVRPPLTSRRCWSGAARDEPAPRRRAVGDGGRAAGIPAHAPLVRGARLPDRAGRTSRRRSRCARCSC